MIFNELPIAFPWYDKTEQQNRYGENVDKVCDYQLITPRNALLPFQFTNEDLGKTVTAWEVFEINSLVRVALLTPNIASIRTATRNGKDYFTYQGTALSALSLSAGYYISIVTFNDGTQKFSEMFFVPDNGFNVQDDDKINYMRLQWWNDADLKPLFYNDPAPGGKPYFTNVLYLDTFITASEPVITEDGTRDGQDEMIATFKKVVIPYRITVLVPDFLKKALTLIALHDHFLITTKQGIRSGEVEKAAINSTLEAAGALSTVDIIFQETIMVKKGCGENMV